MTDAVLSQPVTLMVTTLLGLLKAMASRGVRRAVFDGAEDYLA